MGNYVFSIVEFAETIDYYFHTDEPMVYCVSFKQSFWVAVEHTYEINIQNSLDLPSSGLFDPKIMPTVLDIVKHFLAQSNNKAITYICDNSDTAIRSAARARLFKSWFDKHNTGQYYHVQNEFYNKKKERACYTGLLYNASYAENEKITLTFETINRELNKKKKPHQAMWFFSF